MAATDWQPVSLGDCVDFFSGGTPSKSNASYWTGDIPWVSAKDMKSFYLHDTADHLSRSGAENGTRVMPPGTILMLVRGMTLHNDLPLCVITRPMAFNQDVRALRAKDGVEQAWLAYALLGIKSHLLSVVDSASHGTGRINTPVLRDVQMLLPPPAEQRAIAAVLGALDDKIEVNRKQARVLEQIARAVFKSWFVDFDPVRRKAAGQPTGLPPDLDALFPSRLTDSPIGPVPEGWRVGTLAVLPLFRGIFGGARGTRTGACLACLAEAKHAPGKNGGDLTTALLRGHRGRVSEGFIHCGLLADVPTTAFAWRPARCLAGLVLFVLLLLTRREFEMAVGSETNGPVNQTTAVYERVREFGPLLSAAGRERIGSLPRVSDRPAKAGRFCFTARPVSGVRAGWRKRWEFRGQTRGGAGRRALGLGGCIGPPTGTPGVRVALSVQTLKLSDSLG